MQSPAHWKNLLIDLISEKWIHLCTHIPFFCLIFYQNLNNVYIFSYICTLLKNTLTAQCEGSFSPANEKHP